MVTVTTTAAARWEVKDDTVLVDWRRITIHRVCSTRLIDRDLRGIDCQDHVKSTKNSNKLHVFSVVLKVSIWLPPKNVF